MRACLFMMICLESDCAVLFTYASLSCCVNGYASQEQSDMEPRY